MDNKENIMEVFDEKGNKTEMTILFTTKLDEYDKNYIFYIDEKKDDGQVFVSSYDDSGKLEPVDDEEEWNKLNEVFEISERFTIFRSGELVVTGSTKELDDKKFTYYMTGREFEESAFKPEKLSEKPE